tara:strand:+ start:6052 stop:6912 length:861 start_codon:yes stop_codon:yes gene_type:complete
MLIKEIMERVGMTQTGRALSYIKDALTEMALISETHTNTSQIDLVKDQRYYAIPSEAIKLLDIRVKDHNNDDGLLRSVPRSIYKPVIIDEADPTLSVNVSSLTAIAGITSQTFTISNSDSDAAAYKALTWNVSTTDTWLTLSPLSGESKTDVDTVTATYSKADTAGSYTGSISITSNGGSATIPVNMTIGAAVMTLSPLSFTFETTETEKTLSISNSGESTYNWTIDSSATSNVTFSALTGTNSDETDSITLTVNRSGLSTGSYSQSFSVSDGTITTVIPIIIKVA